MAWSSVAGFHLGDDIDSDDDDNDNDNDDDNDSGNNDGIQRIEKDHILSANNSNNDDDNSYSCWRKNTNLVRLRP